MSSNINSNIVMYPDGSMYTNPSRAQKVGGYLAGMATSSALAAGISIPVALPIVNKMGKIAQSADVPEIKQALKNALEISGMKDKGVSIIELSDPGIKPPTGFKGRIREFIVNQVPIVSASKGKNAFYTPAANSIFINTDKLGTAGFHEIGHAMNHNSSKFWKCMQKLRMPAMLLPALFLTVALTTNKKPDGVPPNGVVDTTKAFIKDNVGVLSTASMMPVLAEELKASSNGNKLAQKLLSPKNFSKVVKSNKIAAITYATSAIAVGIGAYVANKVRDKIAAPKKIS